MLYKLYIGSNNKTGKLEFSKAVKVASENFNGFTAYRGLGYWKGQAERSLILEIETRIKKKVFRLAKELARKLKQEAVGVAVIGKMNFIGA